jgi:anti-sigma B factor antagonist
MVFAPLLVSVEHAGDVRVVGVAGEVDLATAPALASALRDDRAADDLVVDLTRTTFLDCEGLHLLLAACEAQRAAGRGFAVARRPGGEVARLLALVTSTGIGELPLHPTRAAAIAAAQATPAAMRSRQTSS